MPRFSWLVPPFSWLLGGVCLYACCSESVAIGRAFVYVGGARA